MEELKALLGFVGKTLNMSGDEVAALVFKADGDKQVINPEGITQLDEKYRTRVAEAKKAVTDANDEGYKKATRELLDKRDSDLRDKYGISGDKKGQDLIDAIVAKANVSAATKEITEDDVKKSDLYKKTVDDYTQKMKEVEDGYKKQMTEREKAEAKKTIMERVNAEAEKQFRELNPILPKDESKAKEQIKNNLLNIIGQNDFRITDAGEIVIVKEGKDVEDLYGNRIKFNDLVKETSNRFFEFQEGEARGGTGNSNDTGKGQQQQFKFKVPTNDAEYMASVAKASSSDERIAITKAFKDGQKA